MIAPAVLTVSHASRTLPTRTMARVPVIPDSTRIQLAELVNLVHRLVSPVLLHLSARSAKITSVQMEVDPVNACSKRENMFRDYNAYFAVSRTASNVFQSFSA